MPKLVLKKTKNTLETHPSTRRIVQSSVVRLPHEATRTRHENLASAFGASRGRPRPFLRQSWRCWNKPRWYPRRVRKVRKVPKPMNTTWEPPKNPRNPPERPPRPRRAGSRSPRSLATMCCCHTYHCLTSLNAWCSQILKGDGRPELLKGSKRATVRALGSSSIVKLWIVEQRPKNNPGTLEQG